MSSRITPSRAVFELPALSAAQISPAGDRIAWVRTQVNKETGKSESQIWLANADGSGKRQLTQVGTGNSQPTWSPDGATIAYVSRRDGDHPVAIALLGFDGGESKVLTTHSGAVTNLAWSPDGTTIAYNTSVDPENPNETPRDVKAPAAVRVVKRIDYKQDGFGYLNDVRAQVFLLTVASGERKQLTSELVDHVGPIWSPDGTKLAIGLPIRNGLRSRLGILDVASGEITAYGSIDAHAGSPSWSPDGATIVHAADLNNGPHASILKLDVGSGTTTTLVDEPPFLADGAPVWLDESTLLFNGARHGRTGLWTVATTDGTVTELGSWDASQEGLSVSDDKGVAVQTTTDLNGTVGLVSIDLKSGERRLLFNEAEIFFAESPAARWERVSVDRGDYEIEGWLFKPVDFDERKKYPLVMHIHGGPHGSYGHAFNHLAEVQATGGFLVLMTNPRGSTTYSRGFAEAVRKDWGGEDWKDLQAILDSVLERPYIDKDRTGAYGYSYGGFMTSWILGHSDRFKAIVCGAPCFDLESFFGTSDIGHTFAPDHHGGLPWEIREKLLAHSPSTHIHNARTPTMVVHGEADERCPIGQGEQLFISLQKLGVESEFIRYPGGFHGFTRLGDPSHRLDFYTRTTEWFKKYLGDPA
jgi:dipeptidyl aminopeptidase/acylaminoacyl peptidase